jgi:hypothetical protein
MIIMSQQCYPIMKQDEGSVQVGGQLGLSPVSNPEKFNLKATLDGGCN